MRDRRTFLKRAGLIGTVGILAGCSGDGGDGGSDGGSDGSDGSSDGGDGGSDGSDGSSDGGDGSSDGGDGSSDGGDGGSDTATPEPTLSFGGNQEINFNLSPSVPQENLNQQYSPLRDHIQSYVTENYNTPDGLETTMNIGSNYSAVIQALGQGTADLAETGPFAAAVGVKTDNLEIILQRFGYGSWKYKSIIATRNGSDITSLTDLEGKKVAFSDPLSTSGFLYPAAAMKEGGVDIGNLPEGNGSQASFEPIFAGGHVKSYIQLKNENVDAAAMGGFVRDTKAGPTPSEWKSVATTLHEESGIPRAPIVVSKGLSDKAKTALQKAFLEAPNKVYWGSDGKEGTDDDLWFGKVRKATVKKYQPVIDKADTLGIGPDFFA